MSIIQNNDSDFEWDEWENEFRGVVGEMTDEEWGKLDSRLTQMEEQEEGIFAEINKHSETTNNKGKIAEVIGVENKAVNRPSDNDESVGVVNTDREIDQVNKNKVDQVTDNEVSNKEMSESDYKTQMMNMMIMMCNKFNEHLDKQNAMCNKFNEHLDKQNAMLDDMVSNTCLLYTSRCV